MINKKIYYAHHLWKYNTMIEEYELSIIRRYYPQEEIKIINPNGYINQNNTEAQIMKDCFTAIEGCDIIIFSSINGVIGRGVYEEVQKGIKLGLKIYYIENDMLFTYGENYEFQFLNQNNNRLYAIVVRTELIHYLRI
jgi:hypothetical protein